MTNRLHADDAMGRAAHAAAMANHLMDYDLLGAGSPTLDRERRSAALEKAFRKWLQLEPAMKALIESAPATYRKAAERPFPQTPGEVG